MSQYPKACGAIYNRQYRDGSSSPLTCQYIEGHDTARHSWSTIREQDDYVDTQGDDTPQEVQVFLDAINDGRADAYLEAILAAAHSRKRSLRGVRIPYGAS